MEFWKKLVSDNIEGLTQAIALLGSHQGDINYSLLDRVLLSNGDNPSIVKGKRPTGKLANLSIMIGGEVANSFTPLYELTYFTQAWFLSSIATVILNSASANDLEKWRASTDLDCLKRCILNLEENEITDALRAPEIAIVSNLDTDIEPYRYAKHHFWGIPESKLHFRCTELTKKGSDFSVGATSNEVLDPEYFTEFDRALAEKSMKYASTLVEAKEINFSMFIKILVNELGFDYNKIPLYFHKVPKEELVASGPDTFYLKALVELHEPENIKIYSKVVKRKQPWLIGLPCPNCGETSKRTINYRLKNYGKTIRAHCKANSSEFIREDGSGFERSGCGQKYEYHLPENATKLYDFICHNSITINFPARDLLGVLKGTVYQPAVWVVTDVGVHYKQNEIHRIDNYPIGFGDHLEMITSTIEMHRLFVLGKISNKTSEKAKQMNVLLDREVSIFGNSSPTNLTDPDVLRQGTNIEVTDTPASKLLTKNVNVQAAVGRSIEMNYFSLNDLMKAKYQ